MPKADQTGLNEIILYQGNETPTRIEVRISNDSVWLNRNQLAALFNRDVKTIGKHINNIFREEELDMKVVVAKFATTTAHGAIQGKTQTQAVDFYNLDEKELYHIGASIKDLVKKWFAFSRMDSRGM